MQRQATAADEAGVGATSASMLYTVPATSGKAVRGHKCSASASMHMPCWANHTHACIVLTRDETEIMNEISIKQTCNG